MNFFQNEAFQNTMSLKILMSNMEGQVLVEVTCFSPGTVNSSAGRPQVTPSTSLAQCQMLDEHAWTTLESL